MSQDLDLIQFPLRGTRLIEASAGTGKTFTLALLYARLVLGHGQAETAFDRPLVPPEILVVTFTEAATQELRDRIRLRLVEAAGRFETDPADVQPSQPGKDALADLAASYPPSDWPRCARQLRLAAEWMDEAVISTIHGWCNRMLQEHAFDTRGLFQRELVTDQSDLIAEVVRDYWRTHLYPLRPEEAACILDVAKSPAALQDKLAAWLKRRGAGLSYKGGPFRCDSLAEPIARCLGSREIEAQAAELENAARTAWRADRPNLESLLRELRPHLNGTAHDSASEDKFDRLLGEIAVWAGGKAAPNKLKNFAQDAFSFKKTAKVQAAPAHPAFRAIAEWQAAKPAGSGDPENAPPTLDACLLAHAAAWLDRELDRRLRQRAEMGFDDLLRQLDAALDPARSGPHAARLAETIRRQFPVALIDEFQDTDPVQYRIFDRVYSVAQPIAGTALLMIGDPKQAIYGFRGADIHAYLAARAATQGRHYTLTTNFRSTLALVDACNQVFAQAETWDRGAFRFKAEDENPIPFRRVRANGRAETLILAGQTTPALTFWTLESGLASPGFYRETMAASAATQIARWLEQARSGESGFRDAERFVPLRPKDIAILVRTGGEAAVMREALAARGIHSVYLSDRDSVFQTQEAADLLHWLRACASPGDEGLVRAALGTNTLAIPLTDLARLLNDELAWEEQVERFGLYRRLWQRQGVLAMLRQLMQDAGLPVRLIGRVGGERALTNLLHLAEWLQESATGIDGEQALIRHLAEHLGAADEEQILRLESDAELVQIVTIHKSKGLEYPLVLLPFICSWREVDGRTHQVPYRIGGKTLLEVATKNGFGDAWVAADDERLSEDMRLLYVAMTRARHALWLGIAALKSGKASKPQLEKSAIGHLLNGGNPFELPDAVWTALSELRGGCAHIRIEPAPTPDATRLAPEREETLAPARPAPDIRRTPWWIASYTAIHRAVHWGAGQTGDAAQPASADTAVQETAFEEDAAAAGMESTDTPRTGVDAGGSLHGLPRGSQIGTFLHGILEWAADQRVQDETGRRRHGFAAAAASRTLRREMLGRRCNLRGLTPWVEPLDQWLAAFLDRPWTLPGPADANGTPASLALRDLAPGRIQVEMEFWFESHAVDAQRLDALVQAQVLPGEPRPPVGAMRLNGMLKGFIDLVFEHDGRYYLADWKSNWLGQDDAAYSQAAMRAAILTKRYDLQYVLYLLALHRQLKARLPSYDYDRHIGGIVYVFLRGSASPGGGRFTDRPPRTLIEAVDRLFAGTEETT